MLKDVGTNECPTGTSGLSGFTDAIFAEEGEPGSNHRVKTCAEHVPRRSLTLMLTCTGPRCPLHDGSIAITAIAITAPSFTATSISTNSPSPPRRHLRCSVGRLRWSAPLVGSVGRLR